jgi:hypothetical protein
MLKTLASAGLAGSLLFLVPGATGPPPLGGVRHVRFVNEGSEPIAELYLSAVGAGDWQGDLLGVDDLAPGGSLLLDVEDRNESCRVDVKVVRDDGSQMVGRGIDICRAAGRGVSLR